MRVLKRLKNKPICNDFHFVLIAVILLLLVIKFKIFIIVLIGYFIILYKKVPYLIIPIIVVLLLFVTRYKICDKDFDYVDSISGDFLVVEQAEKYFILKGDKYKVFVYKNAEDFVLGDRISCDISISKWDEKRYEQDFDFKNYYRSLGVIYIGNIKEYRILDTKFSFPLVRQKIINFYSEFLDDKEMAYFKACFLGINDLDKNVLNGYSNLFLTHLLVISGMHLMFYYKGVKWIFNHLFKIEGSLISLFVIFCYLLVIGYNVSSFRAFLFLFLKYLNEKDSIRYTKLDIYSISFIIMAFINPFSCYQNSFILSYLISFFILFKDDIITLNNKLLKNLVTNFSAIILTLPFVINQYNEINYISLIISPFLGLFIGNCLLYLIVLKLILPMVDLEFIFNLLDNYLLFLSDTKYNINFPSFNGYFIIVYLILMFCIFYFVKYRKYLMFIFFVFLYLIYNFSFVSSEFKITFIDVGQGDSTLIELPYRNKVILIDSFNDNVDYLKKVGINKIDCLILTHADYDHIGSVDELMTSIKVDKIYGSFYEEYGLNYSINYVKAGYKINMDGFILEVISPDFNYNDSNDNSLVIKFWYNGYSFLFMGDASIKVEKNLFLDDIDVDVLHVGHHGSKTSSTEEFIKRVSPDISIVSVGMNNRYGLPSKNVINILNSYGDVFLTSECGNIVIKIKDELEVIPYK